MLNKYKRLFVKNLNKDNLLRLLMFILTFNEFYHSQKSYLFLSF